MKKNDKIIAVLGVFILILASIGIYYYNPVQEEVSYIDIKDFEELNGSIENLPQAITVADKNPFYALIATPLAVHYDVEGEQEIIPLYIKNFEETSDAIENLQKNYLDNYQVTNLAEMEHDSIQEFSLNLAKNYWKKSNTALLIKNNMEGYSLGINAVPIASYLSIPIIVCDEFDSEVVNALTNLGVKAVIICGNINESHSIFSYLKFNSIDEVVENSTYLVKEKFGELNYLTLANPLDAYPPEILDTKEYYFGPEVVTSTTMNKDNMLSFILHYFTAKLVWDFTIPDDYKYALVEVIGYNHELDGIDEFGDFANFEINPADGGLALGGIKTSGGPATLDGTGNIVEDSGRTVKVLYDCGGKSYKITATGRWSLLKEGKVSAKVIIKKLENPKYPMMQGLSSIAPYLTANHKGIIFAKEDFAFTADDDIRTDNGKTCPGYYLPGRNPDLVIMSNRHVYDNIHQPLNKLLADIAEIDYTKDSDIKFVQEHYQENPIYIAIVGGAMGLPRYVYQNEVEPIGDIDGDGVDDTVALNFGGGGTQSDNIYGNIDPVKYDWSNLAGDIYSKDHPFIENIVGRITGWDIQDADALVVRSIFYNDIILNAELKEWKENFGNLFGAGLDFQKPLWVQILNLPIIGLIPKLIYTISTGLVNFVVGPWKYDTGFSRISCQAIESEVGEDLGFNVLTALHESAMVDGLSDYAINALKTVNLWNRLTFNKNQVRNLAGEGTVKGREILENSNFIWLTGHGSPYGFGMGGLDLVSSSFDGVILNAPNLWSNILKNTFLPHFVGGFWGPGGSLEDVGAYNPRKIASVEFGPSFAWLESCFCGRITGMYPQENIGQTLIHSGVNCLVASTTGSNIPGGYLEPKRYMFDTKLRTEINLRQWERKVEQGIYPEFHFGVKIFNDMCDYLSKDDATVGRAFRDAKNQYLPEDEDWELWWSPPLSSGGDEGKGIHLATKYTSFYEYVLYGDPAFNPYTPPN